MRKAAILIVTGMVHTWLSSTDTSIADVAKGFRFFFHMQLSPSKLLSLAASSSSYNVSGGVDFIPLDVRDAGAQSVLVELAVLLRTAYLSSGLCGCPEQNAHCLQQVMLSPPVQWKAGTVSAVMQTLQADIPLGTFKDNFKQLMRKLPADANCR